MRCPRPTGAVSTTHWCGVHDPLVRSPRPTGAVSTTHWCGVHDPLVRSPRPPGAVSTKSHHWFCLTRLPTALDIISSALNKHHCLPTVKAFFRVLMKTSCRASGGPQLDDTNQLSRGVKTATNRLPLGNIYPFGLWCC